MNNLVFTIVSKNYLAHAVSLGKSFLSLHENCSFAIFLCDMACNADELEEIYLPKKIGIEIIPLHSLVDTGVLDIETLYSMLTRYSLTEINTSVKPFIFKMLFDRGYQKVIFLDPDILVLQNLNKIFELLDTNNIVLTPHILKPFPDEDMRPDDRSILQAGLYNLGFIAIKSSHESYNMLKWWSGKLVAHCFMYVEKGMHVDQKWIDLVPIFYAGVYILKDPVYNVAYWNLHERPLSIKNGSLFVENSPVVFYHFSGFDPVKISRHQNRFIVKNMPGLIDLFKKYEDILKSNRLEKIKKMSYFFGRIGCTEILIPDFIRRFLDSQTFKLGHYDSGEIIYDFLIKERTPGIKEIFNIIYFSREDLKSAFPNIVSNDENRKRFIWWCNDAPKKEYSIHDAFLNKKRFNKWIKPSFGVNLIGYHETATGVGESVRVLGELSFKTPIPFSFFKIKTDHLSKIEQTGRSRFMTSQHIPHNINISVINADQTQEIRYLYGKKMFGSRYNIGLWNWEIEDYFPFPQAIDCIDEIWAWSEFDKNIYQKFTDKPVIRIPYPLSTNWTISESPVNVREKLNIRASDFIFLYAFDYASCFERKNPMALITAFENANLQNAVLIIKTNHSGRDLANKKNLEIPRKNIKIINETLPKNDFMALMNAADCYVSPHRSEGLGITMLEAMYFKKPVIATKYGGIADVLNVTNSFPVSYTKIGIQKDFGPYKKGYMWADPSIGQLSKWMRYVYQHREISRRIGEAGKRTVEAMRYKALEIYVNRICEIGKKLESC